MATRPLSYAKSPCSTGSVGRCEAGGVARRREPAHSRLAGHGVVGVAGDHPDPAVPGGDQGGRGVGGRLLIVDREDRHARPRGRPRHDHVRQGERPEQAMALRRDAGGHHDGGIHLSARQQAEVVLEASRVRTGRADQHRVAELLSRVLDPVEHLAGEGGGQGRLQQADGHALLGDQHPGQCVRRVAESLGRVAHGLRRGGGPTAVVQHPRDGRDRDAGGVGDVLDGGPRHGSPRGLWRSSGDEVKTFTLARSGNSSRWFRPRLVKVYRRSRANQVVNMG